MKKKIFVSTALITFLIAGCGGKSTNQIPVGLNPVGSVPGSSGGVSANGGCQAPGITGTYSNEPNGMLQDTYGSGFTQSYRFVLSTVQVSGQCYFRMQFTSASTDSSNRNYTFTRYMNWSTSSTTSNPPVGLLKLDTYADRSGDPAYAPIVFPDLNGGAAMQIEAHLAYDSRNIFDPTHSSMNILDCGSAQGTNCGPGFSPQDSLVGNLVRSN